MRCVDRISQLEANCLIFLWIKVSLGCVALYQGVSIISRKKCNIFVIQGRDQFALRGLSEGHDAPA